MDKCLSLKELVGEIEDEHDEEEDALWHEEKPGVWMAQAIAELDELSEALGIPLSTPPDEEDVETLGGLVAMLAAGPRCAIAIDLALRDQRVVAREQVIDARH